MTLTTSKSINQGGLCMKKLAAALMCGTMTMSLFATAQAGETGSEQKDVAQEAIDARKEEAEKTGEYQKIVISFFDWTGAPAGIDRINDCRRVSEDCYFFF